MKKKVLVTTGMQAFGGGVERLIDDWIMNINDVDYEILTFHPNTIKFIRNDLDENKIPVHIIRNSEKLLDRLHMFISLYKLAKKFDVVHINTSNKKVILALKLGCKKIIVHAHISGFLDVINPVKEKIKKVLCNIYFNSLKFTAVSCTKEATDFLFPISIHNKVIYLKNGIDIKRFQFNNAIRSEVRKELCLENKIVLGHIGRMTYVKNQEFIIKIFVEIKKRRNDVKLLLVGDGEDRQRLKILADSLQITSEITWIQETEEPEKYLQAMDMFLFPSFNEGLGIAMIEAQCSGLLVYCSTDIPYEASITNRVCRLSLKQSEKEWAEIIMSDLNKIKERKDMSRDIVQAGYSKEDSLKTLSRIYNNI